MKKYTYIFIFLLIAVKLICQDAQFTQFYALPVYLNPAFTGLTNKHRFAVNYRNQWPGIKRGYTSYLASYDFNAGRFNSGIGGFVMQDVVGTSNLVNTQAGVNLAYKVKTGKNSEVRGGITSAFCQEKIDNSKLLFNDQFISGATVSQDAQNIGTKNYLDLGLGVLYNSKKLWTGFSAKHINKPNISLAGNNETLPVYFSAHAGYRFILQKPDTGKIIKSLSFAINYRHQFNNNQLDISTYYFYKFLNFGVSYRGLPFGKNKAGLVNNESVAIILGTEIPGKNLRISYSYDIIISGLSINSTAGAHEIIMVYEMGKEKKRIRKSATIRRKF